MNFRRRPLLVLACLLACVISPPNPKPNLQEALPARSEVARDVPVGSRAVIAPRSLMVEATQVSSKTFPAGVAVDQFLFDFVVPRDGRWSLCISGRKRAGEVFGFYRVLVGKDERESNLPRFKGAPGEAAAFGPECLRDEAGEPELKGGTRVRLRSFAATKGELNLNFSSERM
jgi:hypothetical protein